MSLLELVQQIGVDTKKVANTAGGEWHGPCPNCGGKDRFSIQPARDYYRCRQCKKSGDSIKFCRDFMAMDYRSACQKVGKEPKIASISSRVWQKPRFIPRVVASPHILWQERATQLAFECHDNIFTNLEAIRLLKERGFALDIINRFNLGWNSINQQLNRIDWGLLNEINENGAVKKLWLPKGLVIPHFSGEHAVKLKIRRTDLKGGDYRKYVIIPGSMSLPSLYRGSHLKIIVIVESEFDGMLVIQEAGESCSCLSVGGAENKPDAESDLLLRKADLLLFALDFDDAGKKAYAFWRSNYPNLRPWPVPREKSPGDAFLAGVNLKEWILSGIRKNSK